MAKLVKTKTDLYLRSQPNRSTTEGAVLMSAGTTLQCVECVKGELVNGIDDWYKNTDGLYFWSGGVEEIKDVISQFVWPLEQSYKRITTPFSEAWVLNPKKNHTGVDIAAPIGSAVYAVADCVVKKIGFLDANKTMAQYVGVEHGRRDYCSAYLHIEPVVKVGERLKMGDIIGRTAQLTGMGPHLHFNIWKGVYNNPISHRGALPAAEYVGKIEPILDPAFPNNFVDPMSFYI